MQVSNASNDPVQLGTADMICIAFFFFLRPGEYSISASDSSPFQLEDVQLFRGTTRLNLSSAPDAEISTATFASLTFKNQKNGVRGEVIGQGCSGNLLLCPVKSIARRVLHLRDNNAPPLTPLAHVYADNSVVPIKPAIITNTIRLAVTILGPSLGFLPTDVTARCLRAAGANALLCAGVDTDVIRLLGRWRSDEMLRYLHTQAGPVLKDFSKKMLAGGSFTLIPNQLVPSF